MSRAIRACLAGMGLFLAGCASLEGRPPAQAFRPSAADGRVWLAGGDETLAQRVAVFLDGAIARVEAAHGQPFRSTPRVHVCPDEDCFRRHVRTPGVTAAVVPENRLVLSWRLFGGESARLPGILVHELSHVHLGQWAGHYTPWFPAWFHEGLAAWVAGGSGADFASPFLGQLLWQQGQQVDFTRRDTPKRRHRAADFGLDMHQFYRQSWRFVDYLARRDETAFRAWLRALLAGADFHIAFADAYNTQLEALAADFAGQGP